MRPCLRHRGRELVGLTASGSAGADNQAVFHRSFRAVITSSEYKNQKPAPLRGPTAKNHFLLLLPISREINTQSLKMMLPAGGAPRSPRPRHRSPTQASQSDLDITPGWLTVTRRPDPSVANARPALGLISLPLVGNAFLPLLAKEGKVATKMKAYTQCGSRGHLPEGRHTGRGGLCCDPTPGSPHGPDLWPQAGLTSRLLLPVCL